MDKSFKKAVIRERARKNQITRHHVNSHLEAHEAQLDAQQAMIDEQLDASREAAQEAAGKEEVWSARTQDIRNRLTNKKRKSAERWNRFAGTSAAGGRGL